MTGESEESEDGTLTKIYKGVKQAVSKGSKAAGKAVSKAGKAVAEESRDSAIKWGGEGRSLKDGPKYGNWGGGRYSGGVDGGKVGAKPPVDSSDEAYKKHDLAYERIKNTDILGDVKEEQKQMIKEADEVLIEDLEKLDYDPSRWENPPKEKDRNAAKAYRNFAKATFKVKNYANE
ncbi:MAG: hypothetical protein BA863_05990 [Desulfovibrio sp. S3730MH75]|nr:MAG: hypothetical protein BA863_05990 [Desulfovibrio sp. S3730MH75]